MAVPTRPEREAPRARIVYIGAERVGLACLKRLLSMGRDVAGVFTAHEDLRPRIADYVPFDGALSGSGVPLHKVVSTKDAETVAKIRGLKPDLMVVISWSQLIPPEVLRAGRLGTIGLHYSLLPVRRGGAPLAWALIDGLKESGITLYYMDEGIDTGDIIAQRSYPIGPDDAIVDLLDKILGLAPDLLAENILGIENGKAPRVKQDERKATVTSRRRPEDGLIDWSKPPAALHNFIRALAPPYPCAFTPLGAKRLVLTRSRLEGEHLRVEGHVES